MHTPRAIYVSAASRRHRRWGRPRRLVPARPALPAVALAATALAMAAAGRLPL